MYTKIEIKVVASQSEASQDTRVAPSRNFILAPLKLPNPQIRGNATLLMFFYIVQLMGWSGD